MTTGRKLFVYAVAVVSVVTLGWVALVGSVYASSGMLTVRFLDRESGVRVYLPLPASVVEGAVATGDHLMDDRSLREVPQLEVWMPMVQEVLAVFDEAPDAVFVDVHDGGEHVRVSKRFGSLRVEVLSDEIDLEVAIPIGSVRRMAARLVS